MSAAALTAAFPDWKPPLPVPETRTVTTFLGTQTILTREPRFEPYSTSPDARAKIRIISGDYGI